MGMGGPHAEVVLQSAFFVAVIVDDHGERVGEHRRLLTVEHLHTGRQETRLNEIVVGLPLEIATTGDPQHLVVVGGSALI
jgi:hypothetical protein